MMSPILYFVYQYNNFTRLYCKNSEGIVIFSRSLCLCRKFFNFEYKHIKYVSENSNQTQKLSRTNINPR
jgi:hypothetical protein